MLDLEPIRERCEKATEGPWPDNGLDCWRWRGMPRSQLEDNRHFVAHARIDIPALIAEVERLRTALLAIFSKVRTMEALAGSLGAQARAAMEEER